MALPTSTTNGATATINGIVYTYNSTKGAWYKQSTASTSVPVTISGTLSVSGNANVGNLGSPTLVNGTSAVNVAASGNVTITAAGNANIITVTGTGANISGTANVTGNANVGNLGTAGSISATGSANLGGAAGSSQLNISSNNAYGGAGYAGLLTLTNTIVGSTAPNKFIRLNSSGVLEVVNSAYTAIIYQLADTGAVTLYGNVLPSANVTYNLGATTNRWSTIYTGDLELSNGIGDYTIVEGEEDLFLYNNRSGKTFKFMLQEVDPTIVPPKKGT